MTNLRGRHKLTIFFIYKRQIWSSKFDVLKGPNNTPTNVGSSNPSLEGVELDLHCSILALTNNHLMYLH